MNSIRFSTLIIAVSMLALSNPISAQTKDGTSETSADAMSADWRENYAYAVGLQAVIYGFPAVKDLNMCYSMVEKPVGVTDTPINQWFHVRRPADPTDTTHGSVSNDFLYSVGWYDVRKEPVVVSVPESGKRYFGTQFME